MLWRTGSLCVPTPPFAFFRWAKNTALVIALLFFPWKNNYALAVLQNSFRSITSLLVLFGSMEMFFHAFRSSMNFYTFSFRIIKLEMRSVEVLMPGVGGRYLTVAAALIAAPESPARHRLIRLIAWLPARSLNPAVMRLATFVWFWVVAAAPSLQVFSWPLLPPCLLRCWVYHTFPLFLFQTLFYRLALCFLEENAAKSRLLA